MGGRLAVFVMTDGPFARWAWTAIAVLMLILCAVYVLWTRKKPATAIRR
ncbi:hypothetical protein [Actinoplanes aureus]|uniref:Uncharacterized protein n=1 Tax=Actinoplanes aureus TaxID=2792083 RepID=A0A931FYE6_9ACTN|nr:hypothetical protein [Actinoplanes aureus]MBG0564493.1 hypothetical protein [Actinoplanes aureus]